jgi:hypothetical protein
MQSQAMGLAAGHLIGIPIGAMMGSPYLGLVLGMGLGFTISHYMEHGHLDEYRLHARRKWRYCTVTVTGVLAMMTLGIIVRGSLF